jgi:hypothetical protein
METKKSFILYADYAKYFARLPYEEQGQLIEALFAYHAAGKEADHLPPAAGMAFCFIRDQMDRDTEKYENTIRAARENGKKGGRPKAVSRDGTEKKEEENSPAWETRGFFEEPGKSFNDTVTVNENETETENDSFSSSFRSEAAPPDGVGAPLKESSSLSKSALEKEFNDVWELYPRKAGRKDALNAFIRARKKGVSYATIEAGVREYAEVCRNRDPQYIKYGSSWFTGEGWNDRELEVRGNDGLTIPPEYIEACAGYTF